jgi:hypothetical protein
MNSADDLFTRWRDRAMIVLLLAWGVYLVAQHYAGAGCRPCEPIPARAGETGQSE